jgi:hypothetical protein
MSNTTQIVQAARFCDDHRLRFISHTVWDRTVEEVLVDLTSHGDEFTDVEAFWEVVKRVEAIDRQRQDITKGVLANV